MPGGPGLVYTPSTALGSPGLVARGATFSGSRQGFYLELCSAVAEWSKTDPWRLPTFCPAFYLGTLEHCCRGGGGSSSGPLNLGRRNDLPHLVSKPCECRLLMHCYVRPGGMTSPVDNPGQKNILKTPVTQLYQARVCAFTVFGHTFLILPTIPHPCHIVLLLY